MIEYRIQLLLVRAVTALCALAAVSPEDARAQLNDEASWGLSVWITTAGAARMEDLRTWCDSAAALLGRLDISARPMLQAQVVLLRLRTHLPAPVEPKPSAATVRKSAAVSNGHANGARPKPATIGVSQRKLLAAVKSSGPIRSRDLITLMAGSLSDRTVKRSLKDLATAGLVRRTEGDAGVMYEAVAAE